jgi:glycosyltransferase involved in cell wall biosynthesis
LILTKIIHIITSLSTGGAQMMLYKLVQRTNKNKFKIQVVSLTDGGQLEEKMQEHGIKVHCLNMKPGSFKIKYLYTLVSILKQEKPDIVQTWMYHADLVGGVAAKFYRCKTPVLWGIRHSDLDKEASKKSTIMIAKICAKLSRYIPGKIICCSVASQEVHAKIGYMEKKMIVIPNGFELDRFSPNLSLSEELKEELNISKDEFVIGNVGRFNAQKDHENFIKAASIFEKEFKKAKFILCGDNLTWDNIQITEWIEKYKLSKEKICLIGRRADIPKIMTSLDILTLSSSFGEGFPNVIGEAMACQVPCVVTDVGDSALIVGDTGIVVKPRDSKELAEGWFEFARKTPDDRLKFGINARSRIKNNFDLNDIVKKYEMCYQEVVKKRPLKIAKIKE